MAKKDNKKSGHLVVPKLTCCESRRKCRRCPTRMLKEGTLPDTLRVRRRRLVATDTPLVPLSKKQARIVILAAGTTANSSPGLGSGKKRAKDRGAKDKGAKSKPEALAAAAKRSGRKAA